METGNRPTVTAFIFIARAFISGAFQAAYVYTPEVYPTNMRAVGLGSCSGFARLGAIVTPFVAQARPPSSSPLPSLSLSLGVAGGGGYVDVHPRRHVRHRLRPRRHRLRHAPHRDQGARDEGPELTPTHPLD